MQPTYRSWLQSIVDSTPRIGQGSGGYSNDMAAAAYAGLQYQGDDGGINGNYMQSGGGVDTPWLSLNRDASISGMQNLANQYRNKQQFNGGGDANTAAYYDDTANQLRGQLGGLDRQQEIGIGNIANSFNRSANRLDEQKGVAKRNYDTSVQQNTQGYLNNRNNILTNTRNQSNALQRLLGINGAGNSSAATEQAPYAAAMEGSQNLNTAQTTFGNNANSLDTGWEDTQRSYSNAFEDLNQQKFSQENNLKSSIAKTKADLLDKIAGAGVNANLARGQSYTQAIAARSPYQQQIDSLLSQIAEFSNQYANPVMRTADVAFKAPTLSDYTMGKRSAPGAAQAGGAQANVNPTFLGLLTGQQRDEYGNLLTA